MRLLVKAFVWERLVFFSRKCFVQSDWKNSLGAMIYALDKGDLLILLVDTQTAKPTGIYIAAFI